MSDESPKVSNIKRIGGVAGQFAYVATVQYPGESAQRIEFVGSIYGGPIVMVTPAGHQIPISSRVTDRIGSTLNPEWVRSFFAQ